MEKFINLDYLSPKNRNKTEKRISCDYFYDESIGYSCLEDAFVLPFASGKGEGGVIDKNGSFQKNTTLNASFNVGGYLFDENEVKCVSKDAIFIGTLYSVFGHVITDDLKKLWFLQTEKAKQLLINGADIVYVSWHGLDLKSYVWHILSLAGVSQKNAIRIDSITKYKHIYVPDDSFISKGNILCYTKEFKSTINLLLQHTPSDIFKSADKIYLSRTELKSWKDYGEKDVENIFREKGYTIIHPEKLTFEKQISLYRNANEIVTTEGSISHMLLFCKPHTKVVILKKANYINDYQMMINALANIDVTFIDANHTISSRNVWAGPFYLSITKYISKYLGIKKFDGFYLKFDYYIYLLRVLKSRFF